MKKIFYQQSFVFESDDFQSIVTEDDITNSKADQIIESFVDSLFEDKKLLSSISYSSCNNKIIAIITFRDMTAEEERAALSVRAQKSGLTLNTN